MSSLPIVLFAFPFSTWTATAGTTGTTGTRM